MDPDCPASRLRANIHRGDLIILTNLPSVKTFVDYTRQQLLDLFGPYDPERVHEHIGAPLADVDCTGIATRDFCRVLDGAPFDEESVVRLFGVLPVGSTLVFSPPREGLNA